MNRKKKQKLLEVFSSIKMSDSTEIRISSDEELCFSSSECTSLEGEAIQEMARSDAHAFSHPFDPLQLTLNIEKTEDETIEDENEKFSFAKVKNIDKVNKSFGVKRKRQLNDEDMDDLPIKTVGTSAEVCDIVAPAKSVVSWADTSGLPLCKIIENPSFYPRLEDSKGCNVTLGVERPPEAVDLSGESLTLDCIRDKRQSDMMDALESAHYCGVHANSPQIYQCGTCWDRVKLCVFCFSEGHAGHFLQMADRFCEPCKTAKVQIKEEMNSTSLLWQKEKLYDDCHSVINLIDVGDIDDDPLEIESPLHSREQESVVVTTNESEMNDDYSPLNFDRYNCQDEPSMPYECSEDLQDTLNQAWLSEINRMQVKTEDPLGSVHPSRKRGVKKTEKLKLPVKFASRPVDKGLAVLPMGRPQRQEQVPVMLSTMHKLTPAQTIVKVDHSTNNIINVVAVGRKKASSSNN